MRELKEHREMLECRMRVVETIEREQKRIAELELELKAHRNSEVAALRYNRGESSPINALLLDDPSH